MKVWHFSELAYHPGWEELGSQPRNVIPSRVCDPKVAADLYHRYFDEWQLCDDIGLNIMVNEHHATATCIDSVGTAVPVTYLRENAGKYERRNTTVTLAERPPNRTLADGSDPGPNGKPNDSLSLGLKLAELTTQLATTNNMPGVKGMLIKELNPNGVVADVKDSSGQPAVRPNDVITRINRTPVRTQAEFDAVVSTLKPGSPVVLEMLRFNRLDQRAIQRIVQFTYQ